jgi:hypothetical protein
MVERVEVEGEGERKAGALLSLSPFLTAPAVPSCPRHCHFPPHQRRFLIFAPLHLLIIL